MSKRKLKKRIRKGAKRAAYWLVLAVLWVAKTLHLPPRLFPGKLRQMMKHWTRSMMGVYVSSLGRRAYMDQPCELRDPPSFAPRIEIEGTNRMTEADIRDFYQKGFAGPFTAVTPSEMASFASSIERELAQPSKAFGFKTVRDRHLDLPEVIELFAKPAIVDRLAQLMGPDLQIWRSQVFDQQPGAPPITWHQATTYMLEDYQRPILEPLDAGQLFQLTTWIAVDRATIENGCVQFIPGTHRHTATVKLDGAGGFYAAHFELEHQPDPAKIVSMELEAGQFVIFSERVIHGSPGNRSANRRMGINFRTVQPSTAVYRDYDEHYAMHLEETYKLDHWGVVTLRGEDRYGYNKVAQLPARERVAG